jgi:hypothetical protein
MSSEDKKRIKEFTSEISAILNQNAKAKDAEQLKTLAGIELAVREQVLEQVSPKIEFLLSRVVATQK